MRESNIGVRERVKFLMAGISVKHLLLSRPHSASHAADGHAERGRQMLGCDPTAASSNNDALLFDTASSTSLILQSLTHVRWPWQTGSTLNLFHQILSPFYPWSGPKFELPYIAE